MKETLEIPDCPICKGKHTYELKVERIFVLKAIRMTDFREDLGEKPQPVRFTRMFICPVKNVKFQGSFSLYQTSDSKIKSVKVDGILENEKE